LEVRNSLSHVLFYPKSLLQEIQKMSKLPEVTIKKLKREARAWDSATAKEKPGEAAELLKKAEIFRARRPARQPVCLRIDPFDLSMLKRLARRKGIPFTQLMSIWLHEKIEEEKAAATL
jgi:hypothetical protein